MESSSVDTAHPVPPHPRVLVVDDNPDACASTAMLLQCRGYPAATAIDGRQAIRGVASFAPDLVLLDIEMPGMDGMAVAREIRRAGGAKEPLIAAVSGYDSQFHKQQCATAGFDYYLPKPVDPEALDHLLWLVCRERDTVQEQFLAIKREQASMFYALSRTQLEFGVLILNAAAMSKDLPARERCLERVQRLEQRLSAFLEKENGFSQEQLNTLGVLLSGLRIRLLTVGEPSHR